MKIRKSYNVKHKLMKFALECLDKYLDHVDAKLTYRQKLRLYGYREKLNRKLGYVEC